MGKNVVKVIAFLLCFCVVFGLLQEIFTPKYPNDSTMIVDGFTELEDNSLDVLFIGSSQMFCGISPNTLREETGLESYVFGGSSQRLAVTAFYLELALKTQSPRIVLMDASKVFEDSGVEDEAFLSWNFDPLPLSWGKLKMLYEIFDGDLSETLSHALPLWQRHARWSELSELDYTWPLEKHPSETGGQLALEEVSAVELEYFNSDPDGAAKPVPEDNIAAIRKIQDLCRERDITLIAFKAPSGNWDKAMSRETAAVMESLGIPFINCMDYMDEIGLDQNTDFFNWGHLNVVGAEKLTRYLAQFLTV
ncbi:MAG: hypothetical protein ACI4PH_10870 [Faecousia sp.]